MPQGMSSGSSRRIAVVQHGDYRAALELIGAGQPEPYFGMKYSLEVLANLLDDTPYLMVSLNAPVYAVARDSGRLVGLPLPSYPRPIPGRIALHVWARRVLREVRHFAPTHLLLRCGTPILAATLLEYCARHDVDVCVILANLMSPCRNIWHRYYLHRFVRRLNGPNVRLIGNHKHVAAQSMIDCGVRSDKVTAWDWPGLRHPRDYSCKSLSPTKATEILYVGALSEAKGVGDLIAAVKELQANGRQVTLRLAGDGPDSLRLRKQAAGCRNVHFLGRVGNDEAFQAMRSCTLVCVPSRHEFSEAMPLSLTEALASRTPVVASDHPVFTRAFVDGQGLTFFRAKDPHSLAASILRIVDRPELYEQLSATTSGAFARVECRTSFGDLIKRWATGFGERTA
jgi:glycosyltransferase involved in cell wall biosynthesis